MATKIEWTEQTWNPTTGCTKVSPGCAHCYAEALTKRYTGSPGWPEKFEPWVSGNDTVFLHPDRLDAPLHWKKPRRVFVNSMSDLFHEDVPVEFIDRVFAVMALTPEHTYQVLTKRPQRMREYLAGERWRKVETALEDKGYHFTRRPQFGDWPLPNVCLGVTVENQRWADERIPILLDTPAAVRFISAEPLLGPVDLTNLDWSNYYLSKRKAMRARATDGEPFALAADEIIANIDRDKADARAEMNALTGWSTDGEDVNCGPDPSHLDWVIVGGESGPRHRPFDPDWARSIVAQCMEAGVACFVKQLGGARPGNKLEDLPEDLRVREWPEVAS